MLAAIDGWSWPGNVRELENKLKRAVIMADGKLVTAEDLDLVPEREDGGFLNLKAVREVADRTGTPGVATGLAWTPTGGEILFIEATSMPGKGALTLTGLLGESMRESNG